MDRYSKSEEDRDRSMGMYRGTERHSVRMEVCIIMDTDHRSKNFSDNEQRTFKKRSSAAKRRQMGYTLH